MSIRSGPFSLPRPTQSQRTGRESRSNRLPDRLPVSSSHAEVASNQRSAASNSVCPPNWTRELSRPLSGSFLLNRFLVVVDPVFVGMKDVTVQPYTTNRVMLPPTEHRCQGLDLLVHRAPSGAAHFVRCRLWARPRGPTGSKRQHGRHVCHRPGEHLRCRELNPRSIANRRGIDRADLGLFLRR